jgi:hypothetical protein
LNANYLIRNLIPFPLLIDYLQILTTGRAAVCLGPAWVRPEYNIFATQFYKTG